jgi:hypothetical protein
METMNSFLSLGYNQAEDSRISLENLKVNGIDLPLLFNDSTEYNLSDWWTPSTETTLEASLAIDINGIYSDCLLLPTDILQITVHSYCVGTRIQHFKTMLLPRVQYQDLTLTIPSGEWSKSTEISIIISAVIGQNELGDRAIGAPVINKSRLTAKKFRLRLSGSQTQGNVLVKDFEKSSSFANSIWRIFINDQLSIDEWMKVEHSQILRIEINEAFQDVINSKHFQVLMMTDVVLASLDTVFKNEEKLEHLRNYDFDSGSWVRYLKNCYSSVFENGELSVTQKWRENQLELRSRIQNIVSKNMEMR